MEHAAPHGRERVHGLVDIRDAAGSVVVAVDRRVALVEHVGEGDDAAGGALLGLGLALALALVVVAGFVYIDGAGFAGDGVEELRVVGQFPEGPEHLGREGPLSAEHAAEM